MAQWKKFGLIQLNIEMHILLTVPRHYRTYFTTYNVSLSHETHTAPSDAAIKFLIFLVI